VEQYLNADTMCALQDDVVVGSRYPVAGSKAASKMPKTTSRSSADFETTFDVDGNVETIAGQPPVEHQFVEISLILLL